MLLMSHWKDELIMIRLGNVCDSILHTRWCSEEKPAYCDDEDRDWSYAATNQGTPKIASKPPEARRERRKDPLQVLERVALPKP